MFNRNKLILLSLMLFIAALPTVASADTAADRKIVTSKAYVDTADAAKQNKIAAGTAGQVVTYTGTAGSVGSATVSSAATYNNGTLQNGTDIANITAVETKQDKIPTENIVLVEADGKETTEDIYGHTIVTTSAPDDTTLVGNQFGILSNAAIENSDLDWEPPYLYDFSDRDDLVPTVAAVADALSTNAWHTLDWSDSYTSMIDGYIQYFGRGGWRTDTEASNYLVNHKFLVKSLALKQKKLPQKSTGDAAPKGNQAIVLNTVAGTPSYVYTTAGKDLALTAKSGAEKVMNYVDGTTASATFATSQGLTEAKVKSTLVSLELLKDIYNTLDLRISNIQWSALEWSSNIENAINKYYINTDTGNWPSDYATKLINGEFMAKALQLKQKKLLPALTATSGNTLFYKPQGGETIEVKPAAYNDYTYPRYITAGGATPLTVKEGADNVILYVNGTKTLDEFEVSNFNYIVNGDSKRFIKGALVSLELLRDTYAELNTKITANSRPTGTTGTVATYNGVTNGVQQFTETAIYNTANAYNATNDANKLATAGFVETKQNKIAAGTAGQVVTYTGTAGSVGSATVSSAATYSSDTLTNGSDIANITAVESKVSKTQSTGYQVLTTGTNGTVTADYISVPVTTSGTGRPTSNNAPTGTAAIWIE